MKKILAALMCLTLCLTAFAACSKKSEAVKAVEALIENLDGSDEALNAAYDAYIKLSAEEKDLVKNADALQEAKQKSDDLKNLGKDLSDAAETLRQQKLSGSVQYSETLTKAGELLEKYNALSDEEKAKVDAADAVAKLQEQLPAITETQTEAEKNAALAGYYDRLFNEKDDRGIDVYQRIENVLYALINDYDADERRVVETIKLNEYFMEAQGDTAAARRKFDEEFWRPENRTFADLLSDWAFVEDSNITPLTVRHFAVSCMKKWMYRGYEKYAEMYRSKVKPAYSFDVDGCQLTCSEDDFAVGKDRIDQYYQKRRLKTVLADKMVKIYGMIGLAGILLLLIMGVQLAGGSFSPVALTVGILLVLLGVFMFWRQTVSVLEELKERQRLNIQRFQYAIEELGQWRSLFEAADAGHTDLQAALSQFGSIAE